MFVKPSYEDHSAIRPPPGAADNPTAALYRAALGPVNTARYLGVFERFDAAGRAGLVWNPAAGLFTLNWMAFRGLWGAALVYLAAAEGLALLVLGLGRQFLQWPTGVEVGVLGSLLMLSIVVPGLYGHAMLHAEIRRRMASAVTDAHTVREACDTLARQAPTRQRLKAFVVGNVLLAVLVAAAFVLLQPSDKVPTAAPAPSALPAAPFEAVPEQPAEPVPPPVHADGAAREGMVEPVPEAEPTQPTSTETVPLPTPVPAQPAEPLPILVAPSERASHGINVGLFAEEANAIKVHAQLTEAGLPATLQTVEGPRGPRTRVRVGPLPDRAAAETAAQRIRAMGLEAQIYRQ